jgi:outer membrane pore protein E
MMKKITAVAIAVLVATQAQATEVYKNEKVSLDLNGRAYAGHFFGTKDKAGTPGEKSEKLGANQFIRFGAKGETIVSGTMKAVGVYETQMNIGTNEKTISDNTGNLRTRYAYAGLKDETWGQATFGRQKGAVSLITDWTDKALTDGYGNDALGQATDKFATGRAADVVKYSGTFDKLGVDASYKFDDDTTEDVGGNTNTAATAAAYGAAVTYALPMNISVGTGYNVGQFESAGVSTDAKLWVAGVKYDDKAFYSALNYSKGTDFVAAGQDHTGIEAAVGYDFINGFGLMALYNSQTVKQDGKADVDAVKYYTLGAQYKFNKNLRVAGEYRINNRDTTSTYDYKNDMQLAVRYDF